MPNGFGYQMPRQQGTPDARMVGQMLMQGGQGPQQPQPQLQPGPGGPGIVPPEDGSSFVEFAAQNEAAALRREGAKLMGGPEGDDDGALAAAIGEALTRAGGGHSPNPNPHKQRGHHIAQLQQLGLSETEAMLLGETL